MVALCAATLVAAAVLGTSAPELVQVQVLARHGERGPLPKSPQLNEADGGGL
jgi:hypothetical protein